MVSHWNIGFLYLTSPQLLKAYTLLFSIQAFPYKDDKQQPEPQPTERIRITLTSQNVKSLEKGSSS
jgi:hypothetical protein